MIRTTGNPIRRPIEITSAKKKIGKTKPNVGSESSEDEHEYGNDMDKFILSTHMSNDPLIGPP